MHYETIQATHQPKPQKRPFCQTLAYRDDIDLLILAALSEEDAHEMFVNARWNSRHTISCPYCGEISGHYFRPHRWQWRCKECDGTFSVTTGTILEQRKLPFKLLLIAMFLFVASPKSEASNKIHALLGVTLRTVYTFFGKLREALWEQRDTTPLHGVVHVDGGYFCGKPRRPRVRQKPTSSIINSKLRNRKASIVPRKPGENIEPWNAVKAENSRVVLVLREVVDGIGGVKTRIAIVSRESFAHVMPPILAYVAPGSTVFTDGGRAYTRLSGWFNHEAVNHTECYARDDGVNQNQAESFIARMRRSEFGVLHGMRPVYLAFYANEMAWREDMRFSTLKVKFHALLRAVLKTGWSKAWRGYNQGHRLGIEYTGLPQVI